MVKYKQVAFAIMSGMLVAASASGDEAAILEKDPHYNEMGFFDIHLCNWPERNRFFKILFSTAKYDNVASLEVFTPEGKSLAVLDQKKFKRLRRKNKPEKRVYLLDLDVPESASTGWYSIKVLDKKGQEHKAQDYVVMSRLKRASGMSPSADAEGVVLPVTLKWTAVPGANWYQVYVRDVWTDKLVFRSKLSDKNEVEVPTGKLESGGDYYWTIHSRDTNEHILLGDFHMGSMSEKASFSTAD